MENVYVFSNFEKESLPLNCFNKSLIVINDINVDTKAIPKEISEIFIVEPLKSIVVLSTTIYTILENIGYDATVSWEVLRTITVEDKKISLLLEELLNNYEMVKKIKGGILSLRPDLRELNELVDIFKDNCINSVCRHMSKDSIEYLNIFTNYKDFNAVPGITAIEKEFDSEAKKTFPQKIYNHLKHEKDYKPVDIEKNGHFSLINSENNKKQLNFLDSKSLEKWQIINALAMQGKEYNDYSMKSQHDMLDYMYLPYILLTQHDFLKFNVEKDKSSLTQKTLVSLLLIDYMCNSSEINKKISKKEISPIKMEGITNTIDPKMSYINTVFDYCNIFAYMFWGNGESLDNHQVVFCTFDKLSLPFEIYDFKTDEKQNFYVEPRIDNSLFKEKKVHYFENNFKTDFLKLLDAMFYNNDIPLFFKNYFKTIGIDFINEDIFINKFLNDKIVKHYSKALNNEFNFYQQEESLHIKTDGELHKDEYARELFSLFWKMITLELKAKNESLLEELKK